MPFVIELPEHKYNLPTNFIYMGWLAELLEENKNNPEIISFLASVLNDEDNICEVTEEQLYSWHE